MGEFDQFIRCNVSMKAEEILKGCLKYYPAEIDISRYQFIGKEKSLTIDNVYEIWEIAYKKAKGDWIQLGTWILYVLLMRQSRINISKGVYKVSPSEVDIEDFRTKYLENLRGHESYKDMLEEYYKFN